MGRRGRQHGAAVGAPQQAAARELVEVAARGHRGDAEALLDLGDGHRAAGCAARRRSGAGGSRRARSCPCSVVSVRFARSRLGSVPRLDQISSTGALSTRRARSGLRRFGRAARSALDSDRPVCFDCFRSERRRGLGRRPQCARRWRGVGCAHGGAARRVEVLRRGARAARRQPRAAARRGPRADGRERRRQVHAGEGARRGHPPRLGRDARRRRARRLPFAARRARRGHRGHLPGADALPRPQRRGERRHGLPPAARAQADRPAARWSATSRSCSTAARRAARPRAAGARALDRRPADRRDRQGAELRRPRPDHGRADRRALGPRGRAAVLGRAHAARAGRGGAVHLAPARRGLHDLRHGHRDARRRGRPRRADRRHDAGRDGPAHGRPRAQHAVPQAGHAAGRGRRQGAPAHARGRLLRRLLRGPRGRDRRAGGARRRRAQRGRAGRSSASTSPTPAMWRWRAGGCRRASRSPRCGRASASCPRTGASRGS